MSTPPSLEQSRPLPSRALWNRRALRLTRAAKVGKAKSIKFLSVGWDAIRQNMDRVIFPWYESEATRIAAPHKYRLSHAVTIVFRMGLPFSSVVYMGFIPAISSLKVPSAATDHLNCAACMHSDSTQCFREAGLVNMSLRVSAIAASSCGSK